MSVSTTDGEPTTEAWAPSGRPVLSFLVVILLLFVLATAMWWAGLVSPRLDAQGSGGASSTSERVTLQFPLRNQGPLPVRVGSIELADVPGVATRPELPITVQADEAVGVELSFAPPFCQRDGVYQMRIRVRAPLGLTRTQDLSIVAGALAGAPCPGGA